MAPMFDPNFVLLYVDNPAKSAAFYAEILGDAPVESSPTFVLFVLGSGLKLGLWSRHGVEPRPNAEGGACELGFAVSSADQVRATHAAWAERGWPIAQRPTQLDFGFTFVALDPDGHRLRVFSPGAE
jgi:catechol 2,3-dioxygenase-like lactoylglutathione lyase family enzyme